MIGDDEQTALIQADEAAHEEAIKHIEGLLQGYEGGSNVWRELQREPGHLIAELVADNYPPLPEET